MKHLIIVQNGFLGFHFRLFYLIKFMMKFVNSDYEFVTSDVNNFLKTLDGIENGGNRLAKFIKQQCNKKKPKTISFIGHSLGGLYIRACIGILEKEKFFENIIPKLFITIATPHLGASCNKFYKLFSRAIPGTVNELFLNDKKKIILEMSKEKSIYIDGLKKFEHRIVYGNLSRDFNVNYQTACICYPLSHTKSFVKNTLFNINLYTDCLCTNDNQICQNLSNLDITRKIIDMGFCWFNNHCELASAWIGKKTFVATDIIDYLHKI